MTGMDREMGFAERTMTGLDDARGPAGSRVASRATVPARSA